MKDKKPIIIAAVGAGVAALAIFFKKSFSDMKKSATEQNKVDKAEFEAVKAQSKAIFEEKRFHNTFAKAKANAKKSWDDAHISPSQRAAKENAAREARIAAAKAATAEANARYEASKKN